MDGSNVAAPRISNAGDLGDVPEELEAVVGEGHSSITGKPAKVKLTDFGFEFFGDDVTEEEVARVRNARCCYIGTVDTSKES